MLCGVRNVNLKGSVGVVKRRRKGAIEIDNTGVNLLVNAIVLQAAKDINKYYKKAKKREEDGKDKIELPNECMTAIEFFEQKNRLSSSILEHKNLAVLPDDFQGKIDYLKAYAGRRE